VSPDPRHKPGAGLARRAGGQARRHTFRPPYQAEPHV